MEEEKIDWRNMLSKFKSFDKKKIKYRLLGLDKLLKDLPYPSEIQYIERETNYDEGDFYLCSALVVGSMDYILSGRRVRKKQMDSLVNCSFLQEMLEVSSKNNFVELNYYLLLLEESRNLMIDVSKNKQKPRMGFEN